MIAIDPHFPLDLVYHIAGVNRGTNEEILKGNIQATFNLLEAIRKYGKSSPRIIFTSSSQVYKKINLLSVSLSDRLRGTERFFERFNRSKKRSKVL